MRGLKPTYAITNNAYNMNNFTLMIMMLIQQEMKKCCSPYGGGVGRWGSKKKVQKVLF